MDRPGQVERVGDVPPGETIRVGVEDEVLRVSDGQPCVRRGGGFPYGAAFMRSAHREPVTALPIQR